ncbi:MAG TPA: hypothetical protein VHQ66_13825 [Myxococcota bacterium]|nr:hypothetical protein [Myxococcota bacterium]
MARADAARADRCLRGRRGAASLALAFALLALAELALRGPALAVHPIAPRMRSAHARLGAADLVVVATVESVSEGRIALADARALRGHAPDRFLVKRSPVAPPPLAAGDRALLLLRGARPPYVLVDRPDEVIRLADAAAEARWVAAFEGWLAARARPAAWPALYAAWIDSGPDTLRDLAAASLADPAAPFQPLPPAFGASFGDAAWDVARPLAARRAAAAAALRTGGVERLVERFASAPGEPDPAISVAAVAAAGLLRGPARDAALARALAHADAEVRRAALRILEGTGAPPEGLRDAVARVARDDPESWLRAQAEQVLAQPPAVAAPAP